MGREDVVVALMELFPQVDVRILKALAIEHEQDIHSAVDFLITEPLLPPSSSTPPLKHIHSPYNLTPPTFQAESDHQSFYSSKSTEEANSQIPAGPSVLTSQRATTSDSFGQPSICSEKAFDSRDKQAEQQTVPSEISIPTTIQHHESNASSTVYADVPPLVTHPFPVNSSPPVEHLDQYGSICYSPPPPPVAILDQYVYEHKEEETANQHEMSPQFSMEDNGLFVDNDRAVNDDECRSMTRSTQPNKIFGNDNLGQGIKDSSHIDSTTLHYDHSLLHASPDSSEHASSRDEDVISDNRLQELSNYSVDNSSEGLNFNNDVGSFHGSCSQSTTMNRSDQFLNVDMLENFINDAKSSKIALTSSMDSVVDLVKEAELREQEAHKAKVEASESGVDILAKAEDLKNVLAHANNTNDMQAGEVYGEKSILATEAREFHSRLLGLAEERDKSLSIVEEMRTSLEARIAIAEAERIAAEEEKFSKEDKARKVLAEQESIMDRVVQESHKLQKQAEENSKLREFLVDRGRLIDMLQGEIAVICEDIMSLKKSMDGHVSFQDFLQSKPTSLTSSTSSSLKSTTSDKTAELVRPSDCLETTLTDDLSSKSVEGLLNNQIPTLGVNDNSKLELSDKDEQDLLDYQIPKVAVDANSKTSADDEWDFVCA